MIDGDATSAAIAAASIVAKVTRDRYMQRADALPSRAGSSRAHVGYSTPEHREAIMRIGVSPLHRMSFQSTAYQQLRSAERPVRPVRTVASEGTLEVVEAHEAPRRVDDHADRVEAQARGARAVGWSRAARRGPCARTCRRLRSSSVSHGVPEPGPARLDLHEDQRVVAVRDQVELAEPRAVVARDDREPRRSRCAAARSSPRRPRSVAEVVGHDGDACARHVTDQRLRSNSAQRADLQRARRDHEAAHPCDELVTLTC